MGESGRPFHLPPWPWHVSFSRASAFLSYRHASKLRSSSIIRLINATYLFDLPFESDIVNGNFVPSGYFWENVDGVLVKKYFTELYED